MYSVSKRVLRLVEIKKGRFPYFGCGAETGSGTHLPSVKVWSRGLYAVCGSLEGESRAAVFSHARVFVVVVAIVARTPPTPTNHPGWIPFDLDRHPTLHTAQILVTCLAERDEVGTALWSHVRVVMVAPHHPPQG